MGPGVRDMRVTIRKAAGTAAGPSGHPVAVSRCAEWLGDRIGKLIEFELPMHGVSA